MGWECRYGWSVSQTPHIFHYCELTTRNYEGQTTSDLVDITANLVTDSREPTWNIKSLSQTYDSAVGDQGDWKVNALVVCVQGALTIDGLRAGYAIIYYLAVSPSCSLVFTDVSEPSRFESHFMGSSRIVNSSATRFNGMRTSLLINSFLDA